jgi:hypothetical protein
MFAQALYTGPSGIAGVFAPVRRELGSVMFFESVGLPGTSTESDA